MSLVPYRRQSGMSERDRDPVFKQRSKRNRRSIYGGLPSSIRTGTVRKNPPNPKPKPVSLLELARRDVVPAYAAQRALVDRLLSREDEDARQRADYMRIVYEGMARYLQGMAPAIQGIYQNAAGRTAEYARGAETALALQEGQSAHNVQNVLSLIGAPAGQAPANLDAAGKLYALTGYLPSATLEGQGAAFGSYAAGLPGIYAQKGIADIATALKESDKRKTELRDKLLEIGANQSGDVLKQLGILRQTREQKRQFNVRTAEQRRQFNAEMRFRTRIAKAENLYNEGKLQLSLAELDAEIRDQQRDAAIARRKNDLTAARDAETKLQNLRRERRLRLKDLREEAKRRSETTGKVWAVRNGKLVNTGKPTQAAIEEQGRNRRGRNGSGSGSDGSGTSSGGGGSVFNP